VQLLLVIGGLFLIWTVNLEDGFSRLQQSINKLSQLDVRQSNLKAALRSNVANLRSTLKKLQTKETGISSVRARRIEGRIEQLAKDEQEVAKTLQTVTNTLDEKINFELGQGMKLPFSFGLASLVWLLLLVSLLVRVGLQRDKFWSIIAEAVTQSRNLDAPLTGTQVYEMPIWLAPVPRCKEPTAIASRVEMANALGWIITYLTQRGSIASAQKLVLNLSLQISDA
jgi:hypothetical protein